MLQKGKSAIAGELSCPAAGFILDCRMYEDLRADLFFRASNIESCFNSLSTEHKTVFLFSNQSMIRIVAKTCCDILQRRAFYMCKS